MPQGHKILKTKIVSRSESQAKIVEAILKKGKKLKKPQHRKHETVLFERFLKERQSMKRTVALMKWEKYVDNKLKLEKV